MKITEEQVIKIKEETEIGKSAKEIAELLDITIGMVEYQRRKNGWKSTFNGKLSKYLEEIKSLVEKEVSDEEIAKKYNCNAETIRRFRKKHELERRNLKLCKEKEISQEILEFLLGSVLGDTSILHRGISSRIMCQHSIKQEEYLRHKAEILKSLEPKISFRKNTEYPSIGFTTKGTPSLNYLYEAFYKEKKKCIPFELLNNFSEKSLTYLFMDDGFPIRNGNNICSVGFALCNFSDEELIKFKDFLKNKFELDSYLSKHYNKYYNKYYTDLNLKACSFPKFKNLIEPYIQNWARYKIEDS